MRLVEAIPRRFGRHSAAIWLGAFTAFLACALPSVYHIQNERRRIIAEEQTRLSRAATRIEALMASEKAPDGDQVAKFRWAADVALPSEAGAAAALGSVDGVILARLPNPEEFVGKSLLQDEAYLTHRAAVGLKQTAGLRLTTLAGAPRLIVVLSLNDAKAPSGLIFVSRDVSEALSAWRRLAFLETAQVLSIAAALFVLAGMAMRREKKLQQTADEATQREALFHNLFRGNKAVMLLIDPVTGAVVDGNAEACAFYGYDHDALTKKNITDINILSKEDIASEMAAAQAERRSHFLFRHRLSSGEIRDVEVHSGPVNYLGRRLLYSIIHDVTERLALEKERARLFAAIEQSPTSIVITDVNGDVQYVNPAFTRISGYESQEIVGRNPRILKSGYTTQEEYAEMWRQLTAGNFYTTTFLNRKKDGNMFWERAHMSAVIGKNGQINNYIAVKEDVTELKSAEENLKIANSRLEIQASRLKFVNSELEQFAYVASHDLRQPLRAISSYLQIIDKKLSSSDQELREYIEFAVNGAKRMDQLIIGLLNYSRIGRNTRPFSPVNTAELVSISLQTFAFAIEDAGACVNVSNDMPTVMGDPGELQRLVDNLIGNAIKYRAPERQLVLDIGGRIEDDFAMVWIADNGKGMSASDHERAFGMFQRLGPQDACEGAGIGLAICKKIVERHQGRIRIDSSLDKGCRFTVELPVAGMDRSET